MNMWPLLIPFGLQALTPRDGAGATFSRTEALQSARAAKAVATASVATDEAKLRRAAALRALAKARRSKLAASKGKGRKLKALKALADAKRARKAGADALKARKRAAALRKLAAAKKKAAPSHPHLQQKVHAEQRARELRKAAKLKAMAAAAAKRKAIALAQQAQKSNKPADIAKANAATNTAVAKLKDSQATGLKALKAAKEAKAVPAPPSPTAEPTPKQAAQMLRAYLLRNRTAAAFGYKNHASAPVRNAQKAFGFPPHQQDGIVGPQVRRAAKKHGVLLPPRP